MMDSFVRGTSRNKHFPMGIFQTESNLAIFKPLGECLGLSFTYKATEMTEPEQ